VRTDTVETVNTATAATNPLALLWRLFRAFRRTRPFWGGVWMILGGLDIIYWVRNPIGVVIGGGWNSSAGYILGIAMIVFAVVGWFSPLYKSLVGIVGIMLALIAFIAANLGGFLIGSVLGIIGGSMVWGWGPKRVRAGVEASAS
jgi:hypothetical protein